MRRFDVRQLRDERIPEVGSLTRSATLTGYESLATAVGLDPAHMLQMEDLPTEALSDPDMLIGVDGVARLLSNSALQSRQEAFGLLLAETRSLNNLGILGLVIREEPTLRAALQSLIRYQRVQNGGLGLRLEDAGELAMLHLELRIRRPDLARQGVEMGMAVVLRTLRTLSQEKFKPEKICFIHGAPGELDVHRRVLGVPVEFSRPINAIVCRSRDLDMAVPDADPALGRSVKRWLDKQISDENDEPLDQVRQVVRMLLPAGTCSADRVAERLCLHRRTLNRRLAVTGASISSVIYDVRAEMAQTYLANGSRPIYDVADLLGFASGADFSRWFRRRFGMTASQWMAVHHEPQSSLRD